MLSATKQAWLLGRLHRASNSRRGAFASRSKLVELFEREMLDGAHEISIVPCVTAQAAEFSLKLAVYTRAIVLLEFLDSTAPTQY